MRIYADTSWWLAYKCRRDTHHATAITLFDREPIYGYSRKATPEHIVLDGRQRLTAMYYAFRAPALPMRRSQIVGIGFSIFRTWTSSCARSLDTIG